MRFVKKELKTENGYIVDIYDNETGNGIMSYQGDQILKYRFNNDELMHYAADPKVVKALVEAMVYNGHEISCQCDFEKLIEDLQEVQV